LDGWFCCVPDPTILEQVQRKYRSLDNMMDERMRRQWAATEALAVGRGGVSAVAAATGLARNTVMAGMREVKHRRRYPRTKLSDRIRRAGGGRKPLTQTDPGLERALLALLEPATRGHPQSPLRWTCKSTSKLAEALQRQQHPVTDRTVARLLKKAGYSLQSNRKTREGASHRDRDAQFEYISRQVLACQKELQPVVSIDTKKKELVGEFYNAGREWRPKGDPVEVKAHDFPDKQLGKAIPYGVYDLLNNEGWVSVGIDHDTAEFAAASIRRWWQTMGVRRFPHASKLLITADGGGSNSSRNRLWKVVLQALADELDLALQVCHFPPGTSKWNKIEHRLFCFITKNWRGRPLTTYRTVVNLIASTTTKTGLRVKAALDVNNYQTGIEVSDEQLARVNITRASFHGEWNYTISPSA
jgi:hypothetical protein